jgi:hypothetical protein
VAHSFQSPTASALRAGSIEEAVVGFANAGSNSGVGCEARMVS